MELTMNSERIEQMIHLCENMLSKSYCIYSNFPVACVLITKCGKIFTGCNVENSSYGLSICAERTAAVKAVSEGYKEFDLCIVMTKSNAKISPCGACRQFLSEFGPNMKLYLVGKDHDYTTTTMQDLLPMQFTKEHIDEVQSGN